MIQSSAGLGKTALEFIRKTLPLVGGDLSLLRSQVTLVADNNQWNPISALDRKSAVVDLEHVNEHIGADQMIEDLVPQYPNHVE